MTGAGPGVVEAPDLIRPVVGFRQWRMLGGGLGSLAWPELWQGPQHAARCLADDTAPHDAPSPDCSCGVYAWYEPFAWTASALTADYVAGAVMMWGRAELHATGLRAQHARIVALALPMSPWRKRRRLLSIAEELEVPVVPHRALAAVASIHGTPVPPSLRPPLSWATGRAVARGRLATQASDILQARRARSR